MGEINKKKIAVLMTSYNRKKKTIKCIDRLILQKEKYNIDMDIYLVDDGTDGTGIIAKVYYPNVIKLINGNGDCYWNGGMRLAFSYAINEKYDYYLWMNDDAMIYDDALVRLIETQKKIKNRIGKECNVVGTMQDPKKREMTYGGMDAIIKWWRPIKFINIEPENKPIKCKIFNGNCVLIPYEIAVTVGNLSPKYRHAAGDIEYGLRSIKKGYENWITPGYVGMCQRNDMEKREEKGGSVKITNEIIKLRVQDWIAFVLEYGGAWGKIYQLLGIIRLRHPNIWKMIVGTKRIILNGKIVA